MELILYSVYALFVVSVVIALIKRSQRTVKFCSFTLCSCVAAQLMKLVMEAVFIVTMAEFDASPETLGKYWDVIFGTSLMSSAITSAIVTLGYMAIFSIWYLRRYRGLGNIIRFNVIVLVVSALLERLFDVLFAHFPITNLYAFAKIGILAVVIILLKTPADLLAEKLGWQDERYDSSLSQRLKSTLAAILKALKETFSLVSVYTVVPIAMIAVLSEKMFEKLFTYLFVMKEKTEYVNVAKTATVYADEIRKYAVIACVISVILFFVWYVSRIRFTFAIKERKGKNLFLFHLYIVVTMAVFAVGAYVLLWLIPAPVRRDRVSLLCAVQWIAGVPLLAFISHRISTVLLERIKY